MIRISHVGAAALLVAFAAPASAQSLFATRGLGVPAPPVDARAAALGGVGLGLIGFHTSLVNPAEVAGVTRRGVSAAFQPVWGNVDVQGAEDGLNATRFPLVRILYPFGQRTVGSIAFGSYLDQSWAVTTQSETVIGEQTVGVTDLLRSTGGIAQLRVGAAYSVSPTFSVGVAAGLLTGNSERSAFRSFSGDTTGTVRNFEERLRWNYLAPLGSVGVRWDLAGRLRVSASAMVGGDLDATAQGGDAEDREYGAPMELAAGASARLSSVLIANAGAAWSRYPALDREAPGSVAAPATTSTETVRIGGGVEYQGVRSGVRTYPIRLGARYATLPYALGDESEASEWAAGLGVGLRLGDPGNPAALVDMALERGARTGLDSVRVPGGVSEQLWRFTFSLSLFGN
jgi:hypothetical protein